MHVPVLVVAQPTLRLPLVRVGVEVVSELVVLPDLYVQPSCEVLLEEVEMNDVRDADAGR